MDKERSWRTRMKCPPYKGVVVKGAATFMTNWHLNKERGRNERENS